MKKVKFLINFPCWVSGNIVLVSIPYQSRINPVSFSYHPPIVLLSFSLPEAETIRKQYEADIPWKGGRYEDEA